MFNIIRLVWSKWRIKGRNYFACSNDYL